MKNSIFRMIALAALSGAAFEQGSKTLRMMGLADTSGHSETSRNGGRRKLGNRHVQRQARKARNVRSHRAACRG